MINWAFENCNGEPAGDCGCYPDESPANYNICGNCDECFIGGESRGLDGDQCQCGCLSYDACGTCDGPCVTCNCGCNEVDMDFCGCLTPVDACGGCNGCITCDCGCNVSFDACDGCGGCITCECGCNEIDLDDCGVCNGSIFGTTSIDKAGGCCLSENIMCNNCCVYPFEGGSGSCDSSDGYGLDCGMNCVDYSYPPQTSSCVDNNNQVCDCGLLDCAGNCCGTAILDSLNVCNGTCHDTVHSPCGEDVDGCLYHACNGNCISRTPTLYPNCPQSSVNPTLLQAYRLGILPVPKNDKAIRNKLLAKTINFPLILQATVSAAPTFGSSGFQWMTMNFISNNSSTASGVGQNGITVSITKTGNGLYNNIGMVSAPVFPIEYGVPVDGNQIQNKTAGIFTATFSQPVRDPLVAFSSVGNEGTPVPVIVSRPFTPVWAQTGTTTYQSPTGTNQYTQFTGAEGNNIIKLNGIIQEVVFNYTVTEDYSTVCFGFVNQNR
jgi:hypothetical protein